MFMLIRYNKGDSGSGDIPNGLESGIGKKDISNLKFSVNINFRAGSRIGIKGASDLTIPLLRYMFTPYDLSA